MWWGIKEETYTFPPAFSLRINYSFWFQQNLCGELCPWNHCILTLSISLASSDILNLFLTSSTSMAFCDKKWHWTMCHHFPILLYNFYTVWSLAMPAGPPIVCRDYSPRQTSIDFMQSCHWYLWNEIDIIWITKLVNLLLNLQDIFWNLIAKN